jgi:hypothetical protein
MDLKETNKDQATSWECLLGTKSILKYLCRKDLIELSKCCKSYRNVLERRVLEKLGLDIWKYNNQDIYEKLEKSSKLEEALEFLKTDLGNKLTYVNKFTLNSDVNYNFAQIFVKLLPNVKTLFLYGGELSFCGCCYIGSSLGEGLEAILESIEGLESVYLCDISDLSDDYNTKKTIFPKSIKSLEVCLNDISLYYVPLFIYDTIDNSYINLYSSTIVSNIMIQNLTCGMPNLREVEIHNIEDLDTSKLVAFLKANPQLRKLKTMFECCDEETIKTILFSKCLEYWDIYNCNWKETEFNVLPSNYSIKYINVTNAPSPPLVLKLINACKGIKTLNSEYDILKNLDLLKFERKINKLLYNNFSLKAIKAIDSSRLFNQVHLNSHRSVERFIEDDNIGILKNYKFIRLISGLAILKLINK